MKLRLKPAKAGAKIIKPQNGKFLHEEGEEIVIDKYWRRRMNAGEVVEVKKEVKKVSKKITKKRGDE
jgi:hypothetical protein